MNYSTKHDSRSNCTELLFNIETGRVYERRWVPVPESAPRRWSVRYFHMIVFWFCGVEILKGAPR